MRERCLGSSFGSQLSKDWKVLRETGSLNAPQLPPAATNDHLKVQLSSSHLHNILIKYGIKKGSKLS